jgi:adenosylcobinamide kinase/adenosylcobinamide-phosphate guanylyltransferase
MVEALTIARSELILGGQKSGKSRRAELLARDWLARSAGHKAVLIATAQAWDEEMRERISRHQRDRADRVPGLITVEEPLRLAEVIQAHSQPDTLVVVDCLTLWLTNWLMPAGPHPLSPPEGDGTDGTRHLKAEVGEPGVAGQTTGLQQTLRSAAGPIVLVSNEIGLGVIPLGAEVRAFVDALGRLNQEVAQVCERVTFMAAGLPLTLKAPT